MSHTAPMNHFPNRLTSANAPSPHKGATDWQPVTARFTRASASGRSIKLSTLWPFEKRVYHFILVCNDMPRLPPQGGQVQLHYNEK